MSECVQQPNSSSATDSAEQCGSAASIQWANASAAKAHVEADSTGPAVQLDRCHAVEGKILIRPDGSVILGVVGQLADPVCLVFQGIR